MDDIFCSYVWKENGVERHCRNAASMKGGYCPQHKELMPKPGTHRWTIEKMQARLKEWAMEAAKNVSRDEDTGRISQPHQYTEEELKEIFS